MGPISAAKGYDSLSQINNSGEHNLVLNTLWTLKIPSKLICFYWLLVNERILTWDHLQSCGFSGPSRCVLCERNCEDIIHLFLLCPFSVKIFTHFSVSMGFPLPPLSSVQFVGTKWVEWQDSFSHDSLRGKVLLVTRAYLLQSN